MSSVTATRQTLRHYQPVGIPATQRLARVKAADISAAADRSAALVHRKIL
jgi:hypothetical protein